MAFTYLFNTKLLHESMIIVNLKLQIYRLSQYKDVVSPVSTDKDQKVSGPSSLYNGHPWLNLARWPLTHWGQDKMATIYQTTFSDAFSWMKMYKFWLRFHLSLVPRIQLTIFHIGSDNGLAPVRQQAIIWTNDGKFTDAYMRHSASMS